MAPMSRDGEGIAECVAGSVRAVAGRMTGTFVAAGLFVAVALATSAGSARAQFLRPDEISVGTGAAGALSVLSSIDLVEMGELLEDWRARYPDIKLTYRHKNSLDVYSDVVECNEARPCPDLAWSSAMDLQIKLVNDGYAARHETAAASVLPPWAVWRNEAFGVTAEPIVLVYNKMRVPPEDVPRTHADFIRLLREKGAAYRGKVAAYDPERSGTGFLFWNSDVRITSETWQLVRALGRTGPKLYSFAHTMLDRVSDGDHLFAYNMISSYARARAMEEPALGVVTFEDYTLVMTRIALIPKQAPHPEQAHLFLEFLLSREGQSDLARRAFGAVRLDMTTPGDAGADPARLRPIHVGPQLLTYQDQSKRRIFFREWRKTLETE
ncbi:ABC transporter substrate-binding protein [Xanthobacter oligotrophicus]|uniref:ABC transporter substrate-binding protein n=1 Tax=Xanthobacter oligotrophicus TaxID=2607286 RepID=UPI001E2970D9|nr:ABC transporter substrate-binding protein [Xanthobacter oligotrophicus]MCG5237352.1 ABC transporter substrate-binding protein [Xanthobacter oligotrophicus]